MSKTNESFETESFNIKSECLDYILAHVVKIDTCPITKIMIVMW